MKEEVIEMAQHVCNRAGELKLPVDALVHTALILLEMTAANVRDQPEANATQADHDEYIRWIQEVMSNCAFGLSAVDNSERILN